MRENLFSETYEESRRQFRGLLPEVAGRWPGAGLEAYPVGGDEDLTVDVLTVDVLTAPPRQEKKRLLLLSCGLHGIEGYVGAAVWREKALADADRALKGILEFRGFWG